MAITRIKSSNIEDGTIADADLATGIDATKLTGSIDAARIPEAAVTQHVTPFDPAQLEMNQALLAFKIASSNQLAKFSMVDQVIDEYQDATGIDAGNSTNELAGGSGTAKYYEGGTSTAVTTSSTGSVASTGTVDGDYTYYKWLSGSTGTFTTDTAQNYEYLVVAGGGGGGSAGGGGGAGGYRTATGFSISPGTITGITVGAGGAGGASGSANNGVAGEDSIFSSITADGGGYGAGYALSTGGSGGSGGGSAGAADSGGTATAGQGNNGGSGDSGGGGGAGAVGADGGVGASLGVGGVGLANDIVETGTDVYYAGGGGSGRPSGSAGGNGGGGTGGISGGSPSATAGMANTGGGGGGGAQSGGYHVGGAGGSGVVIIRRLTSGGTTSGENLTLQSVATTAESAPTTADLVVLIEDSAGAATVNTDIKGYVSRDGSAFSSAVTFVDEGDWGTDKRILVARNIDISGITSGVAMKYKLTTHNQVASSKETRIHATSLAWA